MLDELSIFAKAILARNVADMLAVADFNSKATRDPEEHGHTLRQVAGSAHSTSVARYKWLTLSPQFANLGLFQFLTRLEAERKALSPGFSFSPYFGTNSPITSSRQITCQKIAEGI